MMILRRGCCPARISLPKGCEYAFVWLGMLAAVSVGLAQVANPPPPGAPVPERFQGPVAPSKAEATLGNPQFPAAQTPATSPASQMPSSQLPSGPSPSGPSPSGPSPSGQPPAAYPVPAGDGGQPQAPFPALTAAQQNRLDTLLNFWEKQSGQVKTYRCMFTRYEYNPVFGPVDKPLTIATGVLRYAAPDKGEFKVERQQKLQAAKEAGKPAAYIDQGEDQYQHWLCDGNSVFELDGLQKQLKELVLPESMRGVQIADGPLPFMFGASRKKIQDRYWVREVMAAPGRKNEYWLEVYPKQRDDAASFQKITVILDQNSFMPMHLNVFPPGYDPKANPARTVYSFAEMQVNQIGDRGKELFNQFISPKLPKGWKKVVENYPLDATADQPRAATRPGTPSR